MRMDDLPLYYNAAEILEHNLVDRADKIALYSLERTMTFQEVSAEANQVGQALKGLGVRQGETVGLLSLDGPEWVTCFFGTLKIGAVSVGINTLLATEDYDYILNDCQTRVLIIHENLWPIIEPILEHQLFLEHIIMIGAGNEKAMAYQDWIALESTILTTAPTHREDYCTLNYSSGTTGQPKGILHAHKDLPLISAWWGKNTLGLTESDRTFAAAKLFFTYGTGGNLLFPWFVGASIVLFPGSPRQATNIFEMVDRFKPTILYNAPTGYAMALAVPNFTETYDLSSLRLCVSGGERLPAPLWHAWKEKTGLDIIDGIGSTEVYHDFLSNRPDDIRPGSSGKPVEGFEVRLVDDEGNDVLQGEIGNLLIKGETVALSYLHQYVRSRETFRGEWFFTGDKYSIDADGYFWHAGRSDDMLKVGGIWVSPMEVESTLLSHPAVLECAVTAQKDQADLIKPKAFVVLNDGFTASAELEEQLIAHCRDTMAAYKRPRWIAFVESLPKTATGKIQRYKLRSIT